MRRLTSARGVAPRTKPTPSAEQGGLETIADALAARDTLDRTRTVSPLTQAAGALYFDTTGVPIDEVVERVMEIVEAKLATQAG